MATREAQRLLTHRRIYDSALAVFRRDGVDASRLEEIAAGAGVSRAAFYFHFPTKEHVLLERMRETEQILLTAIAALPPEASIDAVLQVLNHRLAAIWEPDPKLLPDLAAAALRETALMVHERRATPLRSELARRFRVAAERNQLLARLPAAVLSDVYLGNTLGGLLAWYGSPEMPLLGVLDAVTDLFWAGVRVPVTEAPAPPRAASRPGARAASAKRATSAKR